MKDKRSKMKDKRRRIKNKRIKSLDTKPNILGKWISIILITFIAIRIIIACLATLFVKINVYAEYYRQFAVDLAWQLALTIFFIGLIIDELIYYYKYKRYKIIIILIIILVCIGGISYKVTQNSYSYKYYKDLHYVTEGTYCEDVQELKNVYKEVITGKLSLTTIYIETKDFKFIVGDNIVEEKDFDKFKEKFNNVKKVKIRYLPNSETLLYIEPVTDGK